jgi:hypothetical protein
MDIPTDYGTDYSRPRYSRIFLNQTDHRGIGEKRVLFA